ncbi:hypothetical protein RI129_000005 [Pyrocoelia pectoralis]|uniref:Protein kinase domain-containing protein n=1 Tax=Pyrocoelia pectoralis TaxID=417401 RepID=A0AAN7V5H4_9COLE
MQPASSQTTVISSSASSSSSSPVGCTSTNNNNVNIVNINNNTTYQSPPASPSSSHSVEESKNQQQANSQQQQQHVQNQQQQVQQQPPQQQTQQPQQQPSQQQTPLVSTASPVSSLPTIVLPYTFGRSYQLTSQIEASNLYLCVDTVSQQEFCCKVVNSSKYSKFLGPHMRMDGHEGINQIQKVIFEQHFTFVLFERSFGDLHSYTLFQQILQIVADCHHNGIVLRDLKLRKFIFANEEKTKLKLETLEGASIFEGDNDILTDKHGCPAYVSPEILYSNSYSGMAADCWSMGVILYTMLIRRGTYDIPETLSKQARCLIRNLIRLEPEHRLTANDALAHRWFQEKWNLNTKERIIQQHISNLHSFQHQQFLFQHSLSDLTLGPPPRAILTPSLIEGLLQLSDDQVVPTF